VQAVGLSSASVELLCPQPSVAMFWSRGVSFRSGPKKNSYWSYAGARFGLFLGLGAVFRYSNSV
jgi:hypothetical protein